MGHARLSGGRRRSRCRHTGDVQAGGVYHRAVGAAGKRPAGAGSRSLERQVHGACREQLRPGPEGDVGGFQGSLAGDAHSLGSATRHQLLGKALLGCTWKEREVAAGCRLAPTLAVYSLVAWATGALAVSADVTLLRPVRPTTSAYDISP